MFSHTGIDLVKSGEFNLEKYIAEEIVVTNGASWKCPSYVRKLPPCRLECPASEDIRGYLTHIAQTEMFKRDPDAAFDEAWYMITDKNPLPAVHGRICPHPCESGCNRGEKDSPVAINNMERFIGDHGIKRRLTLKMLTDQRQGKSVAVIGGGPSGLSAAYQMVRRGYDVTIFETFAEAGGMLRYGIPSYRLPRDILDAEIQNILDLGVELKTNCKVGKDVSYDSVKSDFDAVYLAAGAHKGSELGVEGEDAANVFTAASYLNRVNSGAEVTIGNKIVVVGGGDSAIDAARTSLRVALEDEDAAEDHEAVEGLRDSAGKAAIDSAIISKKMGNVDVTILYRRTRDEMPAIDRDITEAEEEGVNIEYLSAPVKVIRDGGRATAIECIRMELGEPDSSGRRRPVPIDGSEFTIELTSLIVGIGQTPDLEGGMESLVDKWGWVHVDKNSMMTSDEGVYAGGDVLGLGIATRSVGEGRMAAKSIHNFLKGRDNPPVKRAKVIKTKSLRLDYYPTSERNVGASKSMELEDFGFQELTNTITMEQAKAEAERCMSCGLCFVCDQCRVFCPRDAIERDLKQEKGRVMFTDYTKCNGCHVCNEACPCGYIEMGMGF